MDLFSLWEDLVTYIKSNDSEYSEMFELHLYPVSLSGSVLTISTDHTLPKYQVAWLANVYSRKLESYILKTKNQQITIQVDNYRPPKITPNDGPGPVSAHAPAKDMEREKARNVVPPAPSPAPFPEGGIPSPFPEGNEPAPVMESKADRSVPGRSDASGFHKSEAEVGRRGRSSEHPGCRSGLPFRRTEEAGSEKSEGFPVKSHQ